MKNLLQKQRTQINNTICGAAPGIFRDEHWQGFNQVAKALDSLEDKGYWWNVYSAQYDNDETTGNPIRKRWLIQINHEDNQREGWVHVIASGAGSVKDPLSAYDIIAHCA